MLQAMTAKTIGKQQPIHRWVSTEKGIMVKTVNGKVSGPGAFEFYGFESRYPMGKCRPDPSVEHRIVNIKVETPGVLVGARSKKGQVARPLGAKGDSGNI